MANVISLQSTGTTCLMTSARRLSASNAALSPSLSYVEGTHRGFNAPKMYGSHFRSIVNENPPRNPLSGGGRGASNAGNKKGGTFISERDSSHEEMTQGHYPPRRSGRPLRWSC